MQPIAGDPFPSDTGGGASRYVELLSRSFSISDAPHDMTAVSRREAVAALAHEKPGELLDRIFAAFQDYKAKYKHDMILIGGTHEGITHTSSTCLMRHRGSNLIQRGKPHHAQRCMQPHAMAMHVRGSAVCASGGGAHLTGKLPHVKDAQGKGNAACIGRAWACQPAGWSWNERVAA